VLQFNQALGTLDPADVPLVSHALPGNWADAPLYVPAWQEFQQVLGQTDFLFVGDAKGACLRTRATLDHKGGRYLFPLPMTGAVPDLVCQWILRPLTPIRPLFIPTSVDDPTPWEVDKGFRTWRQQQTTVEDGTEVTWRERWLVTDSSQHAQ